MYDIKYYEHVCLCGCGEQIEIKKHHKYTGIPKYILGHNNNGRNPWNTGKKLSEIHKEKIRSKMEGKHVGKSNPFYGKKHKENQKEIWSKQRIGRSAWNKGIPNTEEVNKKISNSLKGEKGFWFGKCGELNPNWNNGSSFEPYSPEFNKQKKQSILERDNYTCQDLNCSTKSNILHIHHIDYNKKNNLNENLITLCEKCHAKTVGKNKRQYWTEFYQNIMENKINV